jgi:hypothetical protein
MTYQENAKLWLDRPFDSETIVQVKELQKILKNLKMHFIQT